MPPEGFTIIGAGAIGGTVGALLTRAGTPVKLVDTERAHIEAMTRRGLSIEAPGGRFMVTVNALHPQELAPPLGTVLLAVKARDTEQAMRLVAPHLGPAEAVVSLQNGLCERVIAELVGSTRTIGAFINFSADYLEPGVVRYAGPGDFHIGEIDGRMTDRVRRLAAALEPCMPVEVTGNISGFLWSKLAYGNLLYATALVDADQADAIERYPQLMVELGSEICEIGQREGIELLDFHGFSPSLYLPRERRDWRRIEASMREMTRYMRERQKPRSGIWRDLWVRRRRTEWDEQCGLAARIGDRHGLGMPITRRLGDLIHKAEAGNCAMAWRNLDILEELRQR